MGFRTTLERRRTRGAPRRCHGEALLCAELCRGVHALTGVEYHRRPSAAEGRASRLQLSVDSSSVVCGAGTTPRPRFRGRVTAARPPQHLWLVWTIKRYSTMLPKSYASVGPILPIPAVAQVLDAIPPRPKVRGSLAN